MILTATKKPVEVKYVLWDGSQKSLKEILEFMGQTVDTTHRIASDYFDLYYQMVQRDGLCISTLEGNMVASIGDYIIKGVINEFYPCKPDVFLNSYELSKGEQL